MLFFGKYNDVLSVKHVCRAVPCRVVLFKTMDVCHNGPLQLFRCSHGVRPKCALNARLKQERFSNLQREAMVSTVLLCFLQKRWIFHVCFLLMIGLYHNLHYLGKILRVLCGISCGRDVKPAFRIKGGPIYELY